MEASLLDHLEITRTAACGFALSRRRLVLSRFNQCARSFRAARAQRAEISGTRPSVTTPTAQLTQNGHTAISVIWSNPKVNSAELLRNLLASAFFDRGDNKAQPFELACC